MELLLESVDTLADRRRGSTPIQVHPRQRAQIWDWLAERPYIRSTSRGLVLHDLARLPDRLYVVDDEGGLAGFAFSVELPTGSALDRDDPVARAVLGHVADTSPASGCTSAVPRRGDPALRRGHHGHRRAAVPYRATLACNRHRLAEMVAGAPRYPTPGPSRRELLDSLRR